MVGAIGFFSGGSRNFLWWGIENITVNIFFLRRCLMYYNKMTGEKKSEEKKMVYEEFDRSPREPTYKYN
jgi:hypothetical protein